MPTSPKKTGKSFFGYENAYSDKPSPPKKLVLETVDVVEMYGKLKVKAVKDF